MEKWKGQEESGKSHLPGAEEVTGSVAGAEERREGRPRRRERLRGLEDGRDYTKYCLFVGLF